MGSCDEHPVSHPVQHWLHTSALHGLHVHAVHVECGWPYKLCNMHNHRVQQFQLVRLTRHAASIVQDAHAHISMCFFAEMGIMHDLHQAMCPLDLLAFQALLESTAQLVHQGLMAQQGPQVRGWTIIGCCDHHTQCVCVCVITGFSKPGNYT